MNYLIEDISIKMWTFENWAKKSHPTTLQVVRDKFAGSQRQELKVEYFKK